MLLFHITLTLLTVISMELFVTWFHKHFMHGLGWAWHKSHHQPQPDSHFEMNDWYAVIFGIATVILFIVGDSREWLWWVALGITLYGLLYGLVHDVLVHHRLPLKWSPTHPYLRRLINAHHMHHIFRERKGGVSFGFLYAPPVDQIRQDIHAQKNRDRNLS